MADNEADESKYANLLFSNKTASGMHPKIYIKIEVLRSQSLNGEPPGYGRNMQN